ncbi:hypothetical protein N658DRAFT_557930 [Parathielavia hyrcaniae]|uniref:5'-3' DNA helicase ZGRF1-like N-terminal domain-containing protein n=1 Tax=Parathielavia hyrcaniae TaxID=113614 RepID=A0AAN6Q3B9_9PEZI|nr:hypothetical protein N658DRAFT_557930 [Parathielavia hyrcaniae]
MPMPSSGNVSAGPLDPRTGGRTAPVLEFVCLFTYDLRRKQKRWEDGRIKYHTFNKRVMVYDERGNYVGDMHWTRDSPFDEGEEVQLERGGVIVQVAECVGRQEQDLSELLDKRAKEKEQRQSRVAMRPPLPAATPNTPTAGAGVQEQFQTRHRPLNKLLTPTGHHGRAGVPVESPFELRQKADENLSNRLEPGASKRRKLDVTPPSRKTYAQNLFGATLTLSAVPLSSAPRRVPGPVPRVQSATSSSQQVDNMAADSLREDRGPSGAHEDSSSASAVASRSVVLPEHHHQSVSDDQEQPDHSSTTLGHPNQEKAVSDLRTSHPRAAISDGSRPSPLTSFTFGVVADKRTAARNSHQRPMTHLAAASTDCSAGPNLGASLSQAIDLKEERQLSGRQNTTEVVPGSKHMPPGPSKPKRTKRTRSPQLTASDVETVTIATRAKDVQEQPMEERTELRLKPRQKRGLLLVSERKNKTTEPQMQDALTEEPTRAESPAELTNTLAKELSDRSGSVERLPSGKRDDPFASSLVITGDPGLLSPRLDGCQTAHLSEDVGKESAGSSPHQAVTALCDRIQQSPKPPDLTEGTRSNAKSAEDEDADRSPSQRVRRVRSRAKGATKVRGKPSEPLDLDPEEAVAGLGSESIPSKPSRQTRSAKKLDHEESSHVRKRTRRPDPDGSAGRQQPQAQVRPHLARLSRKSVRSRELIGFVPSGPDHVTNSGLLPFGARGFEFPKHIDAVGAATPVEPTNIDPPPSNHVQSPAEAQPMAGMPQSALPSTVVSEAAPPTLQRHNSLPNGRTGQGSVKVSNEVASPEPQLDGPHRPRSLARHASAVFPPTGQTGQDPTEESSLVGPKSIVASRDDPTPGATMSETNNPQSPCAADSVTVGPPLHNSPPSIPERQVDRTDDRSDLALDACVPGGANKQSPDAPPPDQTRPRIVNPATRGRKAALKSHAAGRVPQSVLPVESTTAVAIVGVRPPAMPRPDPPEAGRGVGRHTICWRVHVLAEVEVEPTRRIEGFFRSIEYWVVQLMQLHEGRDIHGTSEAFFVTANEPNGWDDSPQVPLLGGTPDGFQDRLAALTGDDLSVQVHTGVPEELGKGVVRRSRTRSTSRVKIHHGKWPGGKGARGWGSLQQPMWMPSPGVSALRDGWNRWIAEQCGFRSPGMKRGECPMSKQNREDEPGQRHRISPHQTVKYMYHESDSLLTPARRSLDINRATCLASS